MDTKKTYVVGLTGGIGSGKTAVSDYLNQHYHIDVIDADVLARQAVNHQDQIGQKTLDSLEKALGVWVVDEQGRYNRALVRERIFSDNALLDTLNAIIHPVIFSLVVDALSKTSSPYAILSVPLLFEGRHKSLSLLSLCDTVLVVDTPISLQVARAVKRDLVGQDNIQAIIHRQISRQDRLDFAKTCHYDIIVNDKSIQDLYVKLDDLHQKYQHASIYHNSITLQQ